MLIREEKDETKYASTRIWHAMTSTDLKIFSFESITAATNNFSTENRLGMGGFEPVYKVKS